MNTVQIRMLRALVQTVGRLSDGVRIACEHGVTSGKSVDYVYRNEPAGVGPLGRLFDRIYLSNRAWQAVRVRRRQLQRLLEWAIRRQLEAVGEAFILDVASGPACYLRDAVARIDDERVEAIGWDLDDKWLDEGQTDACDRGLRNILYDSGDALDARSFRRLPWRPNVVVASGFYDWMGDDRTVRRSMRLIHDAMPPRGHFLFTVQTGHENLGVANGLFPGFDGAAPRMKNRPAELVHGWAAEQGFTIARTATDPWSYYAVTVATKP